MFMVSASGTAVLLKEVFGDRYAMYKLLDDVCRYKEKGFLSDEEYEYEKRRIIENYHSDITSEVKVIRDMKEQEELHRKKNEENIAEARENLKFRAGCTEESIIGTSTCDIQASSYDNIPFDRKSSMPSIIALFVKMNRIPEACKYYMDETGLEEQDAIEFVVEIYKKISDMDREAFDGLIHKLGELKDKGCMEQAVSEYRRFTLTDDETAKAFIDQL